jgi:quercetin dioxygenase-like cupin family protein
MEHETKQFVTAQEVEYASQSIVSKTIIKKSTGTVTVFAFDKGEELSEHTAPFEALVQILDGDAEITIGGTAYTVRRGEAIILPANVAHSVRANVKFKMMLTMIKS